MKLLILALLTAILILTAAIASLAMEGKETDHILTDNAGSGSSVTLYVQNGLWGIRTNSGRTVTEPRWSDLKVMNDTMLIAKEGIGTRRRYGIIDNKGDALVPYVYSGFTLMEEQDLWVAELAPEDDAQPQYHLYSTEGLLCSMTPWDSCSEENGLLHLTEGSNRYTALHTEQGLQFQSHYSEHSVGLRKLTMELDTNALARLHTAHTATALGDAAAGFLSYLFVTPDTPLDSALIGSENPSSLLVGSRYIGYRLQSAAVSRVTPLSGDGLPAYRMQIQVRYAPADAGNDASRIITTAMVLTVARNGNGDFVYTAFSDIQAELAASAKLRNHTAAQP